MHSRDRLIVILFMGNLSKLFNTYVPTAIVLVLVCLFFIWLWFSVVKPERVSRMNASAHPGSTESQAHRLPEAASANAITMATERGQPVQEYASGRGPQYIEYSPTKGKGTVQLMQNHR